MFGVSSVVRFQLFGVDLQEFKGSLSSRKHASSAGILLQALR
jgi:hypothetical protein